VNGVPQDHVLLAHGRNALRSNRNFEMRLRYIYRLRFRKVVEIQHLPNWAANLFTRDLGFVANICWRQETALNISGRPPGPRMLMRQYGWRFAKLYNKRSDIKYC
jgi:hypothetical protein